MSRPSDPIGGLVDDIAARVAERVLAELRRDRQSQSQPTPQPPYHDQAELAARLRVSPRTLEKWRRRGTGPAFRKVGARALYPTDAVTRWLEGNGAKAPSSRRATRIMRSAGACVSRFIIDGII
jgi:hypothetical protein